MICTRCNQPATDFAKNNWCRQCYNAYYRDYYRKKPEKYQKHKALVKNNDKRLKKAFRQHSLTESKYLAMLDASSGKCYACHEKPATTIDHDHNCCPGRFSCGNCIRGLLCNSCNSALGFANDSIKTLEKLINYLS